MNEKSEATKQVKIKETAHYRLKVLATKHKLKVETLATEAVVRYLKNPEPIPTE